MTTPKITRIIIYLLIFAIVILGAWLVINSGGLNFISAFSEKNLQAGLLAGSLVAIEEIPVAEEPVQELLVEDLTISAKAAICVEKGESGGEVLFNNNGDQKLPIASLTKLMSAVIVLENYDISKVTIVDQKAVDRPGKQGFLSAGDVLSLEDLLKIMLVESSNDAAYSLADIIGVDNFVILMNDKAKEIGLLETNFKDPAGLYQENYSTAQDLVKLTEYISDNYPVVWEILSLNNYRLLNPQRKLHHVLINTNDLLGKFSNIIGGKTGLTLEASGCLLMVLKNPTNQNTMIYVILGSDSRFKEMEKLINWTNQAYFQ